MEKEKRKIKALDKMTKEEFDEIMQTAFEQMKKGESQKLDESFVEIRKSLEE